MTRQLCSALLLALPCFACTAPPPTNPDLTLDVDTLVPPGDSRLGKPLDIAIGPDAELFVADIGTHRVAVFAADGHLLRVIGREGAGPGEFRFPRSLFVWTDTLRLVDAGNGRVMVFDTAGRFARSFSDLPGLSNAGVAFGPSGSGLLARHGLDSSLARRFFPDGTLGVALGNAPVPPTNLLDFRQIKADLSANRVPQSLRGHSFPALNPDGSAWILLLVDGVVQRYTVTDSLLWEATVPDSLARRLRQQLFEKNRADTVPYRFVFPNLFLAARPVGHELWVLLREWDDAPAQIAVLNEQGQWARRLHFPGATNVTSFAVDTSGSVLYLIDAAEGTLLVSHVPPP